LSLVRIRRAGYWTLVYSFRGLLVPTPARLERARSCETRDDISFSSRRSLEGIRAVIGSGPLERP